MRAETTSDWFLKLLDNPNFLNFVGMLVGALAIIALATVIIVVSRLCLTHSQRMAMIRAGMHPDDASIDDQSVPPAAVETDQTIYKATG